MIHTGQKLLSGRSMLLRGLVLLLYATVALQRKLCALQTHLMELAGTLKATKLTPLPAKLSAALHTWLAHNSLLSYGVSVGHLPSDHQVSCVIARWLDAGSHQSP